MWTSQACRTATNAICRAPQEQHSLDGFRGTVWGQPIGIDCPRRNVLIICAIPWSEIGPSTYSRWQAGWQHTPPVCVTELATRDSCLSSCRCFEKSLFLELHAFMGDHMIIEVEPLNFELVVVIFNNQCAVQYPFSFVFSFFHHCCVVRCPCYLNHSHAALHDSSRFWYLLLFILSYIHFISSIALRCDLKWRTGIRRLYDQLTCYPYSSGPLTAKPTSYPTYSITGNEWSRYLISFLGTILPITFAEGFPSLEKMWWSRPTTAHFHKC